MDRQTVRILINGKAAGMWVLVKPELQEKMLLISSGASSKSSPMEMTFLMADVVSPFDVGFNDDKRVLGLAVQSIELGAVTVISHIFL